MDQPSPHLKRDYLFIVAVLSLSTADGSEPSFCFMAEVSLTFDHP